MPNPATRLHEGVDAPDPFRVDDARVGDVCLEGFNEFGAAVDPADPGCVAKRATDPETGTSRHWAKRATSGPDAGCLYNPQSAFFRRQDYTQPSRHSGNLGFVWRPVTAECFDHFLRFLATKNVTHLRVAERCF